MQQLLEWLRSGRRLNTRLAANRFQVSRRTIASDIEYLRMVGAPIAFDHRGGTYVLEEPFENLPLVALRRNDFAAFLVAQHALEALGDAEHAEVLEQAARRLAEHLPETVQVDRAAQAATLRFEVGPRPPAPQRAVKELEGAARDQCVARLHYFGNARQEATEREVEPYAVLNHQGRWYLLAYCRLRQAMRDFRIDRIRRYEVLGEVFARDVAFDLDEYLEDAFGMHRGDRTYAVVVRFTPYQARWIKEETWHPSQMMLERVDGSLDVHLQVAGLTDVARWVLSYGAEAEVISPPVLRHRVASEARRTAALYNGQQEGDTDLTHG